jgi:hypothetical protein
MSKTDWDNWLALAKRELERFDRDLGQDKTVEKYIMKRLAQ